MRVHEDSWWGGGRTAPLIRCYINLAVRVFARIHPAAGNMEMVTLKWALDKSFRPKSTLCDIAQTEDGCEQCERSAGIAAWVERGLQPCSCQAHNGIFLLCFLSWAIFQASAKLFYCEYATTNKSHRCKNECIRSEEKGSGLAEALQQSGRLIFSGNGMARPS